MSLVNDMLKDLDQRRKSSDSSGPAADLVPATETPRSGKSRFLLFFVLLLVGVGGGYGYLLYEEIELWDLEVSESLNIIPDRVAIPRQPAPADSAAIAETTAETIPPTTPDSQPPARDSQMTASANDGVETSMAVPTTLTASNTGSPGFSSPAATVSDIGLLQQSPLESILSAAGGAGQSDSGANAVDPTAPMQAAQAGSGEGIADLSLAGDEKQTGEQSVSIVNLPPPESVKDYAEMTPEEKDTLAVQYALRLIAENETIAAYTSLERHIMENRYAHQSRETYGKLLVNDGEYLAARNVVESGLGLAPNHAGFKKIKARILIANGALGEAVDLLSSRAPSIYEDLEYHEILATAQLASRDYTGALNSYTQLVGQDRTQGRWWYGFAASQDALGNRPAARQGYDQALQQSNLSPNLRRRIQERLAVLNQ